MRLWPWSHRGDRSGPDPRVNAAEQRAAELEHRADVAQERLAAILPRLDPWMDSVLGAIHSQRGRNVR